MFKVFESFDFMEAGRVQSLLEANGIETFMKNEFSTGALGDLPFVEVAPMVFVVHEADLPRAIEMLEADQGGDLALEGDDVSEAEAEAETKRGVRIGPGPEPDPT
ncbi:MAG: DUF2007 domain-containing protein [Pseudomonadota bacterium]